jgi:hypothetical protein
MMFAIDKPACGLLFRLGHMLCYNPHVMKDDLELCMYIKQSNYRDITRPLRSLDHFQVLLLAGRSFETIHHN